MKSPIFALLGATMLSAPTAVWAQSVVSIDTTTGAINLDSGPASGLENPASVVVEGETLVITYERDLDLSDVNLNVSGDLLLEIRSTGDVALDQLTASFANGGGSATGGAAGGNRGGAQSIGGGGGRGGKSSFQRGTRGHAGIVGLAGFAGQDGQDGNRGVGNLATAANGGRRGNGGTGGSAGTGGDGGTGRTVRGENGSTGNRGSDGEDGSNGRAGEGGLNIADTLSVAGGGSGASGGGGGGGGGGGSAGGGGGGGANSIGSNGGSGGSGGAGAFGGFGGAGGEGGAGGGGVTISALGRLSIASSNLSATGQDGRRGGSGASGGRGLEGASGKRDGDSGGVGGRGGVGGDGGNGGVGGNGGGGAGGTIRVIGSLIEYDGAFFNLSGGGGGSGGGVPGGGNGQTGRFLALYNTQEISGLSFVARTSVSGAHGPKEENPYTKGGLETPTLPDLEGRANTFGAFQAFDASDPAFAALLLGIPDGAMIGLTRVDDTTAFFGQDFSGYDLLVLSNLTGEDQTGVSFGYDFDGSAEGFFFPGGEDGLLAGLELFLTLIPETLGTVSLQTAFGTIAGQVLADGESFFQTAAPVPVPGAIPLMASGLALAAWRRRRQSA